MVEAIGIIIWVDRQLWYLGLSCIRSSVPALLMLLTCHNLIFVEKLD